MKQTSSTSPISWRVPAAVKEELDKIAKEEDRQMSYILNRLIKKGLKAEGINI